MHVRTEKRKPQVTEGPASSNRTSCCVDIRPDRQNRKGKAFRAANMISLKSNANPLDVKIIPAGKTINECERAEPGAKKQQGVDRKTVAARPWRMMCVCVTLVCAAAFILVNAAWVYSVHFPPYCVAQTSPSSSGHQDWSSSSSDADYHEELSLLDTNETEASTVQFVQKHEWSDLPSQGMTNLPLPVPYVIVSQTFTQNCSSLAECIFQVKFMQLFSMHNQDLADINYNFLIGGDGRVYVGRGWNYMGKHASLYDARSVGITFIGTFNKTPPSKAQLTALQAVIRNGIETNKLKPDYKLLAKRQVNLGRSPNPGQALYYVIKKLPHWVPSP